MAANAIVFLVCGRCRRTEIIFGAASGHTYVQWDNLGTWDLNAYTAYCSTDCRDGKTNKADLLHAVRLCLVPNTDAAQIVDAIKALLALGD